MSPEFIHVTRASDVERVAALARRIWTEHYTAIIGREQVDYMLEKFQSGSAIAGQIAMGYEYYLVLVDGSCEGYLALTPVSADGLVQLSKLYLIKGQRGRGLGRAMVDFAVERSRLRGAAQLWLTVNRHNAGSIAFYERVGFERDGTIVQEIGGGFVMDDYRMILKIASYRSAAQRGMP